MRDAGRGLGTRGAIVSRGIWFPSTGVAPTPPPAENANYRRGRRIERIDWIQREDEEILVII